MAFHRPSFFPSVERAPNHTTTENPLLGGDPSWNGEGEVFLIEGGALFY